MKIERSTRFAVGVLVATAVMLAIVLPVSLSRSERSSEISGANIDTNTGGQVEEIEPVLDTAADEPQPESEQVDFANALSCPCFDLERLERAVSDVAQNDRYMYHADSSCTGEVDTGISYSTLVEGRSGEFHPQAMGYSVGPGFCFDYDMMFGVTSAQEIFCRSLIEEMCSKHATVLDLDDEVSASTCPCFDEDKLDQAVTDINGNGQYTYHAGSSCTGEVDTGISYSIQVEGPNGQSHPQYMGFTVGEGYCREYDVMHDITLAEAAVCKSLIEKKCSEYENVLIPDDGLSTSPIDSICPCFDETKLDKAVSDITGDGEVRFNAARTCTGEISDAIAYSKLAEGKYPVAMGFAVGSGYCREYDMMRVVNQSEEDTCRELIVGKCSQYSEKLAAAGST